MRIISNPSTSSPILGDVLFKNLSRVVLPSFLLFLPVLQVEVANCSMWPDYMRG